MKDDLPHPSPQSPRPKSLPDGRKRPQTGRAYLEPKVPASEQRATRETRGIFVRQCMEAAIFGRRPPLQSRVGVEESQLRPRLERRSTNVPRPSVGPLDEEREVVGVFGSGGWYVP